MNRGTDLPTKQVVSITETFKLLLYYPPEEIELFFRVDKEGIRFNKLVFLCNNLTCTINSTFCNAIDNLNELDVNLLHLVKKIRFVNYKL